VSDAPGRASSTAITNGPAFARGLQEHERFPRASLLHRIFEARSRRLGGELGAADAAAYLSGLMIGSDVSSALDLFASNETIHVVGATQLASLYAAAIQHHGRNTRSIDGSAASLAGLVHVHRLRSRPVAIHGT
jgi:2-dehydro-3-deoxygalactonokinase